MLNVCLIGCYCVELETWLKCLKCLIFFLTLGHGRKEIQVNLYPPLTISTTEENEVIVNTTRQYLF